MTEPEKTEEKSVKAFSPEESNVMLDRTGVNPAMWRMMTELSKQCIASNAFPAALKNPAQALVVMQAGVELGMKPMQAIQSMFFIHGRLSMYSSALLALMKKNGLSVEWKILTAKQVTAIFRAKGQEPVQIEFGDEDAKRAKLSGDTYTKYPQDMYVARCISRAAKIFPDLIGAPIEVREVMDDIVEAIESEPVQIQSAVPEKLQSKQEKQVARKGEKQAAAKITDDQRDTQFMANSDIAEIVEEMKCAETDEDFEGVRNMIVKRSWQPDQARYLGDKFVFYKDNKAKATEPVGVEAAQEVFLEPAPDKKTYEARRAELIALKSVDLKPILTEHEIDFSGMDKAMRITAILDFEYPERTSEAQGNGYVNQDGAPPVNDPVDGAVEQQAQTPPARAGVLDKLFANKS